MCLIARAELCLIVLVAVVAAACGDSPTTPGGPATLSKAAGDSQTVALGAAVMVPPTVSVQDARGNPIQGVTVTFAVMLGGGSATGTTVVTDATGHASVGSWTVGSEPGTNVLSASVADVPPVTFSAVAAEACGMRQPLSLGGSAGGVLAGTSCAAPQSRYVDYYSLEIAEPGAILLTQRSPDFDPFLFLFTPGHTLLAENDDASAFDPSSAIKAIVPAGAYLVAATSFWARATGAYTVGAAPTSSDVTGCEDVFVVRGIVIPQALTPNDCTEGGGYYSDLFLLYLTAGSPLTVEMSSSEVDSFLMIFSSSGQPLAVNDNAEPGTLDARITGTAPRTGYYVIYASSAEAGETGSYTLSVF